MKSNKLPLSFTKRRNKYEIGSIENLLDTLSCLGEVEQGKTRFFRGHSKSSYLMQPSIYRQSYLIENEDKIIRDALTNCPDDFSPNDTLFEKLVKLQHYGYATRLLDLTTNALVALYFATSSQESENGELIVLDIPNEEIKYDDSDTVTLLSAISLQHCPFNFQNCLHKAQEIHQHQLGINTVRRIKEAMELESYREKILATIKNNKINEVDTFNNLLKFPTISLLNEDLTKNEIYELFNQQNEIVSLIHNIRMDKPSFRPVINPNDMQKVLCVRAKLNNARIVRQQGSFLLFGINNNKLTPASIPSNWQRTVDEHKIIVINEHKQKIIQELKSFGISKQTLFPELESQAQEIMAQYKPK